MDALRLNQAIEMVRAKFEVTVNPHKITIPHTKENFQVVMDVALPIIGWLAESPDEFRHEISHELMKDYAEIKLGGSE